MISAIRRKFGGDKDGLPGVQMPAGVQRVDLELQKKYARGVQYNLKIVIRGDRNKKFRLPTSTGTTEPLMMLSKSTFGTLWTFQRRKRVRDDKLKLANTSGDQKNATDKFEETACDARFVDVYKGTHGVIFLKEIVLVPSHIPVLILANRRDMGHHRQITDLQCSTFVDLFNRVLHSSKMSTFMRRYWSTRLPSEEMQADLWKNTLSIQPDQPQHVIIIRLFFVLGLFIICILSNVSNFFQTALGMISEEMEIVIFFVKAQSMLMFFNFIAAAYQIFFGTVKVEGNHFYPCGFINMNYPKCAHFVAETAECAICMNSPANRRMVPCGHAVCCSCLEKLSMTFYNTKCPFCRAKILASEPMNIAVNDVNSIGRCGELGRGNKPTDAFNETSNEENEFGENVLLPSDSNPVTNNPDGSPRARWAPSSMRYAFGMKFVHLFFNIPFLCLQKETLKRQLETNKNEILSSYHELDCYQETPEADYDNFIEMVTQRRREVADKNSSAARPVHVPTSGRVMGGGQPIPGQYLPRAPTSKTTSPQEVRAANPYAAHPVADRRTSFEIVNAEGNKKANYPRERAAISDDEMHNNMVATFEEDFSLDNELSKQMARLGEQRKDKQKPRPVLKEPFRSLQEERDSSATPIAYKIKLNEIDDDSPVRIPDPAEDPPSLVEMPVSQNNFGLSMTSADLDAWLGSNDHSPSSTTEKVQNRTQSPSSDEEFGINLPSPLPKPSVDVLFPVEFSSVVKEPINTTSKEAPAKKKKLKSSAKTETDGNDVAKKKTKKKKTLAKDSQKMLEEFLGPPEPTATEDYDPL
ncbi:unnamed protein product [Caenorhabditis auriculariae]|uniref:RING-type domain-containing protein n=1 Tax=Caenorhabditis auriculariae TaxID=2777116 RepID=A0A8S1GQX4_9PELO|nr:unnamed protein product [Caenorhabditis auriculariae]